MINREEFKQLFIRMGHVCRKAQSMNQYYKFIGYIDAALDDEVQLTDSCTFVGKNFVHYGDKQSAIRNFCNMPVSASVENDELTIRLPLMQKDFPLKPITTNKITENIISGISSGEKYLIQIIDVNPAKRIFYCSVLEECKSKVLLDKSQLAERYKFLADFKYSGEDLKCMLDGQYRDKTIIEDYHCPICRSSTNYEKTTGRYSLWIRDVARIYAGAEAGTPLGYAQQRNRIIHEQLQYLDRMKIKAEKLSRFGFEIVPDETVFCKKCRKYDLDKEVPQMMWSISYGQEQYQVPARSIRDIYILECFFQGLVKYTFDHTDYVLNEKDSAESDMQRLALLLKLTNWDIKDFQEHYYSFDNDERCP